MAESTLSLKKSDLEAEVGFFLGYGRGAEFDDTAWTAQQQTAIELAVKSGLRQFYFPEPLGDGTEPYSWSFLVPSVTLTLADGERSVLLPDDFDRIEGDVFLQTETNSIYYPLRVSGEGKVQRAFGLAPDQTGRPEFIAVQPLKGTNSQRGQRFQLVMFPEAEQDYTLTFRYHILADALSGDRPYAYGGMAHAETIRAACKMAAEESMDDMQGVWTAKFRARLAASIGLDRQARPPHLGYNGDRSDGADLRYARNGWLGESVVTFNSITPT